MKRKLWFLSAVILAAFFCGNISGKECRSGENKPITLIKKTAFSSEKPIREKLLESGKSCPKRVLTIDITYTSEKPLILAFTPENCAFETYCIKQFPASKDTKVQSVHASFYELRNPSVPTLMILRSAGKFKVNDLSVTEYGKSIPDTLTARPLRKNNPTHKQIMANAEKAPGNYVLLFGDSLTDNWRGKLFDCMRTSFSAVNAGICGDKIEDVLFRMEEMADILKKNPPSVVTFCIGTNNIGLGTNAAEIAEGIFHLVYRIHRHCPNAKVIVFGIPARGLSWDKHTLPYSDMVNRILLEKADPEGLPPQTAALKDMRYMYFDISPLLVDVDTGKIRNEFYANDALHFSEKGYTEVVTPFVAGAIRLISRNDLPPHYLSNILHWQRYLHARYNAAEANFSLEEQLGLSCHLKSIAPFWMNQFQKLENNPDIPPDYPEELIRQSKGEKLPPSAGIRLEE